MTGEEAARLLRERAESYSRDAATFAADGNEVMMITYRTIASELRYMAGQIA